jgi:hypothetical protein
MELVDKFYDEHASLNFKNSFETETAQFLVDITASFEYEEALKIIEKCLKKRKSILRKLKVLN